MRKSVEDPFISYSERRGRWYSTSLEEDSSTNSPEKIEGSFNLKLLKQKSHIQSNIYKFRHKSFQPKPTEIVSQDPYGSRKSSLSMAQQLLVMDSIEKGYNLFKNVNSNMTTQRPKHIKLEPISKTIEVKGGKDDKQKDQKTLAQQIEQLKQRKLKPKNQKLDYNIKQNGKLAPLRLILSNKVRNKIVQDLLNDDDQTKHNIQKILERENEHDWIHQFGDLKKSLDLKNEEKKRKHHKQLVSRSTYNNVYYEFLALDSEQKKEYLRKSRKAMREDDDDTRHGSAETEEKSKEAEVEVEGNRKTSLDDLKKDITESSSRSDYEDESCQKKI